MLILWGLFILLIPFYVVKGGLPQPGDALVLILVPVVLFGWNGRLERRSLFAFRALVWFTLWVTLVDLAWAAILNKWGFDTIFPVYYIYNAAIFLTALVLYERHRDAFITLTLNALFVSVVMQVTISIVYRRGSFRSSLFFDNPNQLGYYALLVACIIALTHRRARFGLVKTGIGLTACGYLALLSASRAAAAGIALLVVLQVFSNPRVIATATVTALVVMLVSGGASNAFDSLQERVVQDRSPNLSFFEQRGYDRIWNNKEYLLAGAGEGNRDRFAGSTAIGHAEIHSSVGTVLFSYGLIGIVLFSVFLWRLLRGSPIKMMLVLAPPLSYTIAHQGLRFTMLWVLLAIFMALKVTPATDKKVRPALATAN